MKNGYEVEATDGDEEEEKKNCYFIPLKSDDTAMGYDGGDDVETYNDNSNNMHENKNVMVDDEKRNSLTIHDISITDDYFNDLDISMDDGLEVEGDFEDDYFHLQEQYPQTQRKKSFIKTIRTQESQVSLQSFTSMNSFSSHQGEGCPSSGDHSLEMGDLRFCTDEEVATLMMYGEDEHDDIVGAVSNNCDDDEKMLSSSLSLGNNSNNVNVNNLSSNILAETTEAASPNLAASLPPSSTLGTGAFSTVRLAWRKKTSSQVDNMSDDDHSNIPSMLPCQAHADFNKGELVAVKIIQKSILKQIKSIQRGPNNRIMVQTAYDNIEREIATMKRLRHPNLVRLFEVIDSVESDRLYMVLEYVPLGKRKEKSFFFNF